MNNKQKQRYTLAVYFVLALLSIIFALVGINYLQNSSPLQSLLLNLSTDFAGVVLIFFIVNRFFALNDDSNLDLLTKQIDLLRSDVNSQNSPLTDSEIEHTRFDLNSLLREHSSIDLLGYTHKSILGEGKYRTALINAIMKGAKVRVLIVDATSTAGELIKSHSNHPSLFDQDFEQSVAFANEIVANTKDAKGKFELRFTSWIPSCSMLIGRNKNGDGIAKIQIHLPSFRQPRLNMRSLILSSERHKDDFVHFSEQFEFMWQNDSYLETRSSLQSQNH